MDFLDKLRLRGLFSGNDPTIYPMNGPAIKMQDTTGLFDSPFDPSKAALGTPPASSTNPLNAPDSNLSAMRNRARPYLDQYAELLKSEPTRDDHQLSKLGKALAAGSGLITGAMQGSGKGIETFRGLADEPLRRAREDYSIKGGRLKELAGVEEARIKDEEKLEVAIAADEDKRRDDIRNWIKTQSDIDLNSKRGKQIDHNIKTGNYRLVANKFTGMQQIVDMSTGGVVDINKIDETPAETDARELKDFKTRYGVEQAGRIAIKGMDQAHDKVMQNIKAAHDVSMQDQRQEGDERLTRLKSNLDKLSPTQRNAAFDGAYKQVLLMNPAMKDMLFDDDGKGNIKLKENYNPDLFNIFTNSVQENMRQGMGEPSTGFKPGEASPKAGEGINAPTDIGSMSGLDPARVAQATAWLNQKGYQVDNDSIAEFIRQDDIEKAAGGAPQVTMPEQTVPQVKDVGLEAFKSIPGILGRNVYFGNYPQQPPTIQMTDPNSDTGLNAIGGLIDSIRNAPQNIYDPQGLARNRNRR